MFNRLSVALIAGVLGLSAWQGPQAQVSSSQELTAVPQTASAFKMKRCVNMGNSLETPNGVSWGRAYTAADYNRIRAAGFDTVRIPIRWSDYTGPEPDYRIHPDFMTLAKKNLANAKAAGLNVILNVHHFEELMENPQGHMKRFRAIWRELATTFAGEPSNIWFEVLNEPHKNLKGKLMQGAQLVAIAAIRESNPNRIIILGGEEWSGINSLSTNIAPPDNNIVYTFHYYDPFDFTHQQAEWLGENMPKGKRGWGSKTDREELAQAVETATSFRKAVDQPVFLGEFGVNKPVKNSARVRYVEAVSQTMESVNIPWCLWAYGNTFELYNDDTGWDQNMLSVLTPQ